MSRLTKDEWHKLWGIAKIKSVLHQVWTSIFVGDAPGMRMAAAADNLDRIAVRDLYRTIPARTAIRCVLSLDSVGLGMALYIRPPREIREAAAAGDIERVRKSGLQLQGSGWDPETRPHLGAF